MNLRQIFRPMANKAAHFLITLGLRRCHRQKRQKTDASLISPFVQAKAPSTEGKYREKALQRGFL
jgi:hypothetical protein